MHEVVWIEPLPAQQGLVAFECESSLYMTSEILPPLKLASQAHAANGNGEEDSGSNTIR
jgi:hypothetical protein